MSESNELQAEGTAEAEQKHENVVFKDATENAVTTWDSSVDPTMWTSVTSDSGLGSFLARPQRIFTGTWTENTVDETIAPWVQWANTEAIAQKLSRFAYLRGNLKIRIVVNGSPFLYGKLFVGYVPLALYSTTYNLFRTNIVAGDDAGKAWAAWLTGSIHGFLDASLEHSLEMEFPMILPRDSIRLFADNDIAVPSGNTIVELDDLNQMGILEIKSMNNLRVANPEGGTIPTVTYTIFAWMEDAEVYIPTTMNLTAAMAMKGKRKSKKSNGNRPGKGKSITMAMDAYSTMKDEFNETVNGKITVEGVASALADVGDQLSAVPVIGPFATAGSIAARGVAGIAKIFGWSRPTTQEPARFVQQMTGPHTAATEGAFMGFKLAVDPKNQVTSDPRVMNSPVEDEMSIPSLACRKGYFATFQWTKSDSAGNNPAIGRIAVHPYMQHMAGSTANPDVGMYIPTPMAFSALPFRFWRGNITYTFQCVASKYHRGRVAIIYQPNFNIQNGITQIPGNDYNTTYTHILDIAELDGHSMTVPWTTSRPMLGRIYNIDDSHNQIYIPNKAAIPIVLDPTGNAYSNGYIEIQVLNELQGPTPDPPPVEINVFAHCDDLFVAAPDLGGIGGFTAPAGVQPASSMEADNMPLTDFDSESPSLMLPDNSHQQLAQVLHGERIASFRTLMKRFQALGSINDTLATVNNYFGVVLFQFPNHVNQYVTGNLNPGAVLASSTRLSFYDYLRYAYVGARGSFRYRINGLSDDPIYNNVGANLAYNFTTASFVGSTLNILDPTGIDRVVGTPGGMVNTLGDGYPLAVELPYYSADRFKPCSNEFVQWDNDVAERFGTNQQLQLSAGIGTVGVPPAAASANVGLNFCYAAGDDFSFHYFMGAPPRFYNITP